MSVAPPRLSYGEPRHAWLDWLRCISILMVLGTHFMVDWRQAGLFMPIAGAAMRIGWSGVDFFFAISGFLIGNLLLGEIMRYGELDSWRFYIRRAAKIWPLYYLACLLYVVTGLLLAGDSMTAMLHAIAPTLLHLQNYLGTAPGMGHFWSLAVEEHFYLLLPIVLILLLQMPGVEQFRWRLLLLCIAAIITVMLVRIGYVLVTGSTAREMRFLTHFRIDALFCGVLLATLYRFWPHCWRRLSNARVLLVAAAAIGIMTFAFDPNTSIFVATLGYTSIQLLFCAAIIFCSRLEGWQPSSALKTPLLLMAFVGRHSYPIYLLHPFFWEYGSKALLPLFEGQGFVARSALWLAGFAIFVTVSIGVGVFVGELVERPLLALRNRTCPPRSVALERPSPAGDWIADKAMSPVYGRPATGP
ncbi:acyltransferase [Croceibacterium sp. TMG7-5b_MA50]|uniref:acyltransferase family protein n=1 Tax=Croceibacterium sp. TMG7-5b_MA50 TaxID=3121290 RepID=UPI003221FAB1